MSMKQEILHELCAQGVRVCENEALSAHTSFRVGGPAVWMAFPKDAEQLALLLRLCWREGLSPRILGAGTNVLAPDEGIPQPVVCTKNALTGCEALPGGRIAVMAGESLARAAVFACEHGLSGLEFAHGIPGTLGGGVFMNAGAYGGEMKQVVESVDCLSLDGAAHRFDAGQAQFGYRTSLFSSGQYVIVRAVLKLSPADESLIRARMRELLERRRASQPLDLPSAGSTFKRPQGYYAGALIEQAGLKGRGVGRACVSEKHAGFVVNLGGATAKDVLETVRMVQAEVQRNSGVLLEPEIRIW